MKKLLLPAFGLLLSSHAFSQQTAKLQVIHNCPTPVAGVVDVYAGAVKLIDDFAFRTATAYVDVPAGVNIRLGIALGNSASVSDTLAGLGQTIKLEAGKEYVAIASGLVGSTTTPFKLIAFEGKSSAVATMPASTPIAIHHGSPDAPRVDIVARGVATLATASYGETAPYQAVPSASYVLDVNVAGTSTTVISYTADLSIAPNVPVVAFASGLLSPASGEPAFGIFVVTPAGGKAIELPVSMATGLFFDSFANESNALYPNPASGYVNLKSEGVSELSIYNSQGSLAKNYNGQIPSQLDLNGLESGFYTVKMKRNNNYSVQKLSVVK